MTTNICFRLTAQVKHSGNGVMRVTVEHVVNLARVKILVIVQYAVAVLSDHIECNEMAWEVLTDVISG